MKEPYLLSKMLFPLHRRKEETDGIITITKLRRKE
jgi:hypothetical protein